MKQDAFDSVFEALCQRLLSEEFTYLENNAEIKTIDHEKHRCRIAIEELIKQHTVGSDILKKYMRVHSSYRDRQEMGMYLRGIKSVFNMLNVKGETCSHEEKPVDEALTLQTKTLEMLEEMENIDESLKNAVLLLDDLETEIISFPDISKDTLSLLSKYKQNDADTWYQWCAHVYEIGENDCLEFLKEYGLLI